MVGLVPCFRKEAGAHGKDMKGLFRVHQFEKVEQFVFCKPEDSWKEHERLLQITEKFYEILEIPFQDNNFVLWRFWKGVCKDLRHRSMVSCSKFL